MSVTAHAQIPYGSVFNSNILGETDLDYGAGDVVLSANPQRMLVAHTYEYVLFNTVNTGVRITAYSLDGLIDSSFGTNGVWITLNSPSIDEPDSARIAVTESGGVILGYTIEHCVSVSQCQKDIQLHYLDSMGVELDQFVVAFDRSNAIENQDDALVDLEYRSLAGGLAVLATVDQNGINGFANTDFGLAIIEIDPFNDTLEYASFSGDGKAYCAPNQNQSGVSTSEDIAGSVVYNGRDAAWIVGGTAYEGNGDITAPPGTNFAFCEFANTSDSNNLINQWSTQNIPPRTDEREILGDMAIRFNPDGNMELYAAGAVALDDDTQINTLDMAVIKYLNTGTGGWQIDTSFGGDRISDIGPGWGIAAFQVTDNGIDFDSTEDLAQGVALGTDGTILLAGYIDSSLMPNGERTVALAQFTPEGKTHHSWGTNQGTSVFNYAVDESDEATSIIRDPINLKSHFAGVRNNGSERETILITLQDDFRIFGSSF